MSIASLVPIRIGHLRRQRPVRKHRAVDEVERLQTLLTGANILIAGMQVQLDDKDREHAETVKRIDERHAEVVEQLQSELAAAERRIAIACQANAAADQTQEIPILAAPAVMPLHRSPMAARRNPDHVPGWVKDDQPEPAA